MRSGRVGGINSLPLSTIKRWLAEVAPTSLPIHPIPWKYQVTRKVFSSKSQKKQWRKKSHKTVSKKRRPHTKGVTENQREWRGKCRCRKNSSSLKGTNQRGVSSEGKILKLCKIYPEISWTDPKNCLTGFPYDICIIISIAMPRPLFRTSVLWSTHV